jgi:predicted DNA-binding helix-hairpin-helix protein
MLVQVAPDRFDKLQHLGGMATDDVLSSSREEKFVAPSTLPTPRRNRDLPAGVYRAAMPNGKSIALMRVMFTDFCMMDCHYCPNSTWVPRKRYGFTVDELAGTFMELYERQTVAGLFLSSGIAGSPDKTMDKLLNTVEALRKRYSYRGYIHLKVMPGASAGYVKEAARLGTRLSINMETPTDEMLKRIAPMKNMQKGILDPMSWIHEDLQEHNVTAVGQVTQMVVGAADESDKDIYKRMRQLYGQWGFKRVYYQSFRPARYTPLEEHPATPDWREHRLYQVDWLSRIYGYTDEELTPAFGSGGFLDQDLDPKVAVALERLDGAVDVNTADRKALIRVPGIGPLAADRILANRRGHAIDTWRDLQAMGVAAKRAKAFVTFNGYKPTQAKQLKMELVQDARTEGKQGGRPNGSPLQGGGHAGGRPNGSPLQGGHTGGCASCTSGGCGTCPVATLRRQAA